MNTKICTNFICPCNNNNYVNKASFKQHQKSEKHLQWERIIELKELKIKLNKLEIDYNILKNTNEHMKLKINELESINSFLFKNTNIIDNLTYNKVIPVENLIDLN